jgi:hypothetical protein
MEAASGGQVDGEIWAEAMTRYFEVVRSVVPDDLWEVIGSALMTDPVLKSIQRRIEGATGSEPIDAEIIEEEDQA